MQEAASLYVRVQADVSKAVAGLKTAQGQFAATGASAKTMSAQIAASSSTTRRAATSYSMAGAASTKAAAGQAKVATSATAAAGATGKMSRAAQNAKGALQGYGLGSMAAQGGMLAFAYAGGKSIKIAVDFDRAMRNVNSIAQLSEGQFQDLSSSVKEISGRTAQTPQKLAEGLYDLVSSGFSANEALRILESSALAASAGLTTTEVSTAAVAAVLNAYQLPAKQAGKVSDILFKTVDRGVISFDALANNIGDVLPFAASLGVGLDQVGASISTMTKAGINPAETMTRIKAVMAAMISPSEQLKQTMRGMGYSSGEAMIKALGFQGSLDKLSRSTGGSKQKLAELFPNIRALGGVMAVTGGNARTAKSDVKAFGDAVGATKTALSEQKKSTQFRFDQAKADAEALAESVGSNLLPAIENAVKTAQGLGDGISAAGDAIDKVAGEGTGKKIWSGLTAGWPDIFSHMKGEIGRLGSMASQAWHGKKPAKVPIAVVPKVDNSSIGAVKKQIEAAGKSKKVSLSVTTDAKKVSPQIQEVIRKSKEVDKQKPSVKITTPGADAARSRMAQLMSDIKNIPSEKTVHIKVKSDPVPKHAAGGTTKSALVEVNERGPESVKFPNGTYGMIGDGSRQITALPIGSHVYTAAQTARMQKLAGGGKIKIPKRKKGEKMGEYRDRVNRTIDRVSTIRDSKAAEQTAKIPLVANPDGTLSVNQSRVNQAAITTAKRHLSEAKKKRGAERKEAVARARAELAEARQRKAIDDAAEIARQQEDAKRVTEEHTAALKAQADAIEANTKQLKDNKDFADRVHTATKSVTDTTLTGMIDGTLGGALTDWVLTNSPRMAMP